MRAPAQKSPASGGGAATPPAAKEAPTSPPGKSAAAPPAAKGDETLSKGNELLLDLYQRKRLCTKSEYRGLRHVFAERFEQQHGSELRKAFGDSYDKTKAWLDAHVDLKEELYTAIDPAHDKVVAAMTIFKDIVKRFPNAVVPYGELAIATAVVWDDESGVYDPADSRNYAKAKLAPGKLLGGAG